jgi:hypothetical protein
MTLFVLEDMILERARLILLAIPPPLVPIDLAQLNELLLSIPKFDPYTKGPPKLESFCILPVLFGSVSLLL